MIHLLIKMPGKLYYKRNKMVSYSRTVTLASSVTDQADGIYNYITYSIAHIIAFHILISEHASNQCRLSSVIQAIAAWFLDQCIIWLIGGLHDDHRWLYQIWIHKWIYAILLNDYDKNIASVACMYMTD